MATTCTISIASDIAPGFGGISETMTLTQAGTVTDIDSTTGFQIRKLSATASVALVDMSNELVETKDSTAAKVYFDLMPLCEAIETIYKPERREQHKTSEPRSLTEKEMDELYKKENKND